jgi:hypothetical protein
VVSVRGREPLRCAVRSGVRSCGPGADHRGELGVDQGLVQRLGRATDAVADVGGLERLEQLEQGRLVQGHRVAFL